MSFHLFPSDPVPPSPAHSGFMVLSLVSAVFAVSLALIAQSHTFLSLVLFFFIGLCPLLHLFSSKKHDGHHASSPQRDTHP